MFENSQSSGDDVQTFSERMLIDRIFMGEYLEKRYVNKLNTYKDLIVLNPQEQILANDLAKVKERILNDNTWYGFTEPQDLGAPATYCIWTTFDEPNGADPKTAAVVFGEYWFQIKSIRFGVNTIEIQLKVLRPIEPASSMPSGSTISSLAQQALEIDTSKIQRYVNENVLEVDWVTLFNEWKNSINQIAYRFVSTEITFSNFVHCIQLFGSFCMALATTFVNIVHWIGEFTLRLIFELTRLIHTASPIIMALISLLSKTIGGLYILLAMIWKDLFYGDNKAPKNNFGFNNRPALTYREDPRPFLQRTYRRTAPRFNSNPNSNK